MPNDTWDPETYLRFADQRLRPALDLLARVSPQCTPETICDLGCGTGNVTRLLAGRWPDAALTGIDASAQMLARAPEIARVHWQCADLAHWRAPAPVDLLFSNAALHWLDDHAALFPRLFGLVAPGGVLAVQMPRQHLNPTHRILFALVRDPAWSALQGAVRAAPVHAPARYHDWLAPDSAWIDIWETEYQHVLTGADPVLEWVSGSLLRPVLARLDGERRAAFLEAYRARLAAAYPRRPDGTTLLAFRRIFIVAGRRD
ncbi:MAG: methyltransferase domain-containing protein [Gammaproteobacteria bacterium]